LASREGREPGTWTDPATVREAAPADEMLAWAESAREDLDGVTGLGESASSQVRVTVAAQGEVLDVALGPRALRLDRVTLAEEVVAAVARAQQDAALKTRALMREGIPGFDPDEVVAQVERLSGLL
jgi:DNA-binding protein YbaB